MGRAPQRKGRGKSGSGDDVVRAAQHVVAIMGNDIRHGRLDPWLKPEEAAALSSLERAVRRAGARPY